MAAEMSHPVPSDACWRCVDSGGCLLPLPLLMPVSPLALDGLGVYLTAQHCAAAAPLRPRSCSGQHSPGLQLRLPQAKPSLPPPQVRQGDAAP